MAIGGAGIGALVAGLGTGYAFMKDQQSKEEDRTYTRKAREFGVRKMEAEDKLLDRKTEIEQLRQNVDANELEFQSQLQPQLQALKQSAVDQQQRMQPVQQATEAANAQSGQVAAQAGAANAGDTAAAGTAELQTKLADLREKQSVNLWGLYKTGDKEGALQALSKSNLLFQGKEFKDILRGTMPVKGPDGQPIKGQDGKEAREEVMALVPKDGSAPVYIPTKGLDALYTKHKSQIVKAGDDIVRVNADGTADPLYQGKQFASTAEGGQVYSTRTGQPPAAGGIGGGGQSGRRETAAVDDRVKMAIDKVILPKFGGKFEGGMFFPDEANKDVALRASQLSEQYIRTEGMDPVAAATKAVAQAEREKAIADTGGGKAVAPKPYAGPTPWKR